jgi:mRNA interferase MazF
VNLEPSTPPEFGKTRPAVVVSNTVQNEILDTVVVVPLSTKPKAIWPLRLQVKTPDGKDAYAVLPGIRQVDKRRLIGAMGVASPAFLRELDGALIAYLT